MSDAPAEPLPSGRRRTLRPAFGPGLARCAAASAVLLLGAWAGVATGRADGRLVADVVLEVEGFPEISGIAWCAARRSLIAVSDDAGFAEIGLDGRVLRHLPLGDDLEGVVVTPDGARAFALEEREPALLEIDLDRFTVIARHPLPPLHDYGRDQANEGFEGLSWDPDTNRLVVVNERRPAAVARLTEARDALHDLRILDCDHANDLIAGTKGRTVVLSRTHGLRLIGPGRFPEATPWRRVEARRAEGLALVPGHGLFVAIDEERSRLFVYRDLDDFEKLAEALDGR